MTPDHLPASPPLSPPPSVPGPAAPGASRRRPRPLVIVGAVWALLLVAGGVWYSRHGQPTIREQTTVVRAAPTVDRAIEQVINAAGAGVVVAITGYERVEGCAVTPVRPGARYRREVFLAARTDVVAHLLDRIAAGLPDGYRPSVAHPSGGPGKARLGADAGDYVAITGSVQDDGLVVVSADTGCRPVGGTPATDPTSAPPAADRAAVQPVLDALGVADPRWSTHRLPCGLRTVEATGAPRGTIADLPATSPAPLLDGADVYADAAGLLVRPADHRVTVTFTTGGCGS